MKLLYQELEQYCRSDAYPFHMPGHKRNRELLGKMYKGIPGSPYEIDITEIDGFDNLHHAEGILREAQQRASALYGAKESFFLINGSTCGLLSSVFACTKQGGAILMARNCHKAVYHAAELRGLRIFYLYPTIDAKTQLNGEIQVADVEKALKEHPEVTAVLLTSPTYDGFVSDIKTIADIVHAHGKYLIVDEAHGAHFGFSKGFPENSLKLGADLVVHSLHKTLPSFTQTALLSVSKGSKIESERVKKYLGMFETSSPSYVFMAGMDQCIAFLQENKEELFRNFENMLSDFYQSMEGLERIHIVHKKNQDPSKLVIFADGLSGQELADILRGKYHLEVEMAAREYVIALTTIFDTVEGFNRLKEALIAIDGTLDDKNVPVKNTDIHTAGEARMTIAQATECPGESMEFKRSAGRISGEYLYLYPPGIPLIVPGEVITEKLVREIEELLALGFEIQGMQDYTGKMIRVV